MTPLAVLRAAAVYAGVAFAAGFACGTVRVLLLAPLVGPLAAVLIETPVMLAVSWFVSRWAIRRFAVPPDAGTRLSLGALAFALVLAFEAVMAIALFGGTPAGFLASYSVLQNQIGLVLQALFALIPWAQTLRVRSSPG